MGSISVSLKVLEEKEEALKRMSRRVGSIESEFAAIRNALDWDVRNENGIDRDMQKILDRLRGIEAGLRNAGMFLQDSRKAYETAEEKLKQNYSRIGEGYQYGAASKNNIWDKLLENEKVRNYLWNSGKQIVMGNFTDEVTLLGTAGQIALGFTGLDVVGDIRDLTADIVKWKWSWSHIGQTLIDLVALVPVIGLVKYGDEAVEVIKSGLKNGGKLLEEGSEISAKYWDEVSKVIEKHWEEACAVIRRNGEELIKALKKYGEEVAEAVSGKWEELIERINSCWGEAMKNLEKFRDEFAETFKNCWEQVAAGESKVTDKIIETVSGKWDEFAEAVKQAWDKVSEQGTKLIDEAMGIVGNKRDEIAKLVADSWDNTCETVGKYWDNVAATLGGYWKGALKLRGAANGSEELLEAEVKHGNEVAEVAEDIEKQIDGISIINSKVGGKIPVEDFKSIRSSSIHNPDADSMTLGKYTPTIENGAENWTKAGPDSYISKAGDNSTYFDLGSEWNNIQVKYNLTDDEMFEYFNIPALDDAVSSNKTIRFSHRPDLPRYKGSYLEAEWEYLQDKYGYSILIEGEGGIWYAE